MDNLNKNHDDSHTPITPPAVSYYITDWDEFLEGCKHWFGGKDDSLSIYTSFLV